MTPDESGRSSQEGWGTLLPAAMIAIYAHLLGYKRDGLEFLLIFLTPFVLLPMLALCGASLFRAFKVARRRNECCAAIALILASPLLTYVASQVRDPVRFMAWAPFHRDVLNQNAGKDGIVTTWDKWGWIGWSNGSYLARDSSGRLGTLDRAKTWKNQRGLSCDIVKTQRVWLKWYVVTTRDCSIDLRSATCSTCFERGCGREFFRCGGVDFYSP